MSVVFHQSAEWDDGDGNSGHQAHNLLRLYVGQNCMLKPVLRPAKDTRYIEEASVLCRQLQSKLYSVELNTDDIENYQVIE